MPGQKVSCPLEPSLACWGLRQFPEHPQDPAPNSSGLCCAVPSGAGHRGSRLLFSPAPRGSVSDHCCAQRPRELSMPLGAWLPAHLAPGPHHPLRARLRVAEPRAVGPQRLLAEARLRAGHQALLLATATGLGALGAGRAWGGVRAQPGPKPPPPAPHLRPLGLTSLQEEVYQLRQGWAPQGWRAGGGVGPAWQWKGRSGRRSRVSTHCTSRTEEPPPQLREHWVPKDRCADKPLCEGHPQLWHIPKSPRDRPRLAGWDREKGTGRGELGKGRGQQGMGLGQVTPARTQSGWAPPQVSPSPPWVLHTLLQLPACQVAQGRRWQRRAGWGRPAAAQSSSRPELQRTDLQTAPRPQVVEHCGGRRP